MKRTRSRRRDGRALHIARGGRTLCHVDAAGLQLQPETAPITAATCRHCAPAAAALRVAAIEEPALDPLEALTEHDRGVYDEMCASAKHEWWEGYVPHSGSQTRAIKRLLARGLAVATGHVVTYTRPRGEVWRSQTYKPVERADAE